MHNIIVREALLSDAENVAKIHLDTWQCAYRGQLPDVFLDSLDYQDRLKSRKEILTSNAPRTKHFVAELDGKIVGFLDLGPCRDDDVPENSGELYAIYIDAQTLGQGIGSALMKEALKAIKELDFETVYLWVLESNERSRHFYEKHGWITDGKTKIEQRPDATFHEIRYKLHIK